jgi:hypothetical protein
MRKRFAGVQDKKSQLQQTFGPAFKSYLKDFSNDQLKTIEHIRARESERGDPQGAIKHANNVARQLQDPMRALGYAGAAASLGGRGRPSRVLDETINIFLEKALELAREFGGFDPKKGFSFISPGMANEFASALYKRSGGLLKGDVVKGGRGRSYYYVKPVVDRKLLVALYERTRSY